MATRKRKSWSVEALAKRNEKLRTFHRRPWLHKGKDLRVAYATHWRHFQSVVYNATKGCDFCLNRKGFLRFIKTIGPVPKIVGRLSVGRKDHSRGYVKGNYMWQSLADNIREQVARIKPYRKRKPDTKETRIKRSLSVKKSWRLAPASRHTMPAVTREKIRKSVLLTLARKRRKQ